MNTTRPALFGIEEHKTMTVRLNRQAFDPARHLITEARLSRIRETLGANIGLGGGREVFHPNARL